MDIPLCTLLDPGTMTKSKTTPDPILIFTGKVIHYDNLLAVLEENFKDKDLTTQAGIDSVSDFIQSIFREHFHPEWEKSVLPGLTYTSGDTLVNLKFLNERDVSVYVRKGDFLDSSDVVIRRSWAVTDIDPKVKSNITNLLQSFVNEPSSKSMAELREEMRQHSTVSEEEFDQKWAAYLHFNEEACRAEREFLNVCIPIL